MAADPQSLRRRAVYACLQGMLDEASIMKVLGQLSQSLRSEQATDVIRFVDSLAGPFGLDGAQAKRLYADIYRRMREPEANLPPDPLPQESLRFAPPPVAAPAYMPPPGYMAPPPGYMPAPAGYMPAPAGYAPPPGYVLTPEHAQQPVVNPVAAALAAASTAMPALQPAAAAPAPAPLPPAAPLDLGSLPVEPQMVFGSVMRRIISEVAQFHTEALDEVRKDALAQLEMSRTPAHAREAFREAWGRARQHNWQLRATHPELSELTRVVYLALVDAFGRAGADQILQRALQLAESLPEARQFSPRRLLAAM
ncbi:MAG: hypothetical protein RLZZ584_793 [Pseudomonadota bacterium]|jgi:hypothetical protein